MKILQLCKKFPYPLKDGESIAVTYLSKAFRDLGCEVTLLAMNTSKHQTNIDKLPAHFNHYQDIHAIAVNNDIHWWGALRNLFSSESYHVSRFISEEYTQKLVQILKSQDFDIIQLETPFLAPYIPTIRQYSNAKIVMRAHNVEHEIWERVARNTSMPIKKWYLHYLTDKLRVFEVSQLQNYDMLVAISSRDLQTFRYLGYQRKGCVAPIGLDAQDYCPNHQSFRRPLSISFIGSLDWMPNIEGLQWFLNEVWYKLHENFPELTFHIAGRNAPEWLLRLHAPNVIVHGEVENAIHFINQHSVMVVPLFSGSGMRAKILEGMALGKVIITSLLGLEGIEAKDYEEILLADTAEDYTRCIQFCYDFPEKMLQIGDKAQDLVASNYNNLSISRYLLSQYHKLLKEKTNTYLTKKQTK